MPIYEYVCRKCNAKFDRLVRSMSGGDADDKAKCPECGSPQAARVVSTFAVGAEGPKSSSAAAAGPGMCGRCGGEPGSCQTG